MPVSVFSLFLSFAKKEYQTESKRNKTFAMIFLGLEGTLETWSSSQKSHEAAIGVKTGRSRVGVPNCASKANGNRRQGTQCFTQVRDLSMEVKPYFLLD